MNPELDFEKRYRLIREIIETIVLTLLMFLIIRFAVQNFNVDGFSMEPSLHNNELILVDKWTYLFRSPQRGDVIVFVAPPAPSQDYVKRIIAIPGDRITIDGIKVYVDGVLLNETYVDPARQGNIFDYRHIQNLLVPPNDYFVMGDNRIGSDDSRHWGFVPRKNIIGRAAFVYWPLGQNNYGFLPNVSAVFTNIHQPGQSNTPDTSGIAEANAFVLLVTPPLLYVFLRKRSKQKAAHSPGKEDEQPDEETASG
ncbi:MAG TPA: signal peptidase I [Ktedonobacteraceae bacterium]|jgi:signal peptidase I|nr:signal peptidase I [Ktedonobacteraceae bacterium]